MRNGAALVVWLACLASLNAQADLVKEDLAKLQGTWTRIYVDVDGKKTEDGPKEGRKAITLVIQGNKYGDEAFTINPAKNPKQIDVASTDDKGKAINLPGIYELKGDELKLCFPFPFEGKFDKIGQRPTEFGSKRGGNDVLEVYRRQKK